MNRRVLAIARTIAVAGLALASACSSDDVANPEETTATPTIAAAEGTATERPNESATTTPEPSAIGEAAAPASTSTAIDAGPGSTSTTVPSEICGPIIDGVAAIEVDGVDRTYEGRQAGTPDDPRPAVLLLHGFTSNPAEILATTRIESPAADAGVAVVAPLGGGTPSTWTIGGDENPLAADDTAFITTLRERLDESACVDDDHVWLAGFSAGSAYTGVFGCVHPDRFAGLFMVAGLPPVLCPADAGLDVVIVHGTDDVIVSFDGGAQPVGGSTVELEPVPESAAGYADRAGCDTGPAERILGNDQPTRVTEWTGCAGDATVTLVVVEGGNHVWPGGVPAPGLDDVRPVVEATCLLLAFATESPGDVFDTCFR